MKKAFFRILIAGIVALIFSSIGVEGSGNVLQPLYTVLGILYSIAMSLIVSFNLSQVRNTDYRKSIRVSLKHIRNTLTLDFAISSIALILSLCVEKNKIISLFTINELTVKLNIPTLAICIVIISMLYEVLNFYSIQSLNDEIVEKIIDEENMKL